MEQSPSIETNSYSAIKKICHLLWNPDVHFLIHKSLPLDFILSQINAAHSLTSCFCILLSMPVSSKLYLYFRFSKWNLACISHISHSCYVPHPSHPPSFNHPYSILWRIQIMKLLIQFFLPSVSSHRSRDSLQHPVFRHPQSVFFCLVQGPSFTCIHHNR